MIGFLESEIKVLKFLCGLVVILVYEFFLENWMRWKSEKSNIIYIFLGF